MLQRFQRPTVKFINVYHGVTSGTCTMARRESNGVIKYRLDQPGLKPRWVVSIDGEAHASKELAVKARAALRQTAVARLKHTAEYRAYAANPRNDALERAAFDKSKEIAKAHGLGGIWA